MKIHVRLMLVIIPVLVVVHLLTSLIAGIYSTRALEEQARENAQLLSHSYSEQLDSTIDQYLNVSQDLGSAVITAIHIETTLQAVRKRKPQFSHVFYTLASGKVLEMAPYKGSLLGYDFSKLDAWQRAFNGKSPTMSAVGDYFGQKAVVFFAPATLSYVENQEPTVEGVVALVLPLTNLFKDISEVITSDAGSVFILDDNGIFLHHKDADLTFSGDLNTLSSVQSLERILDSMTDQLTGFATYSDIEGRKYIAFSPVPIAKWSLGVTGTYAEITAEIKKITLINVCVILLGIICGAVIIYFVVRSVVLPIEQLTKLAQKIATGDRTITSEIKTNSEIGQLSTSINSMVSELRDYQTKLEVTVEERTIELKKTNEVLEQTNVELNTANAALQTGQDNLEIIVEKRTKQLQKALNYIDNIIDSMPSILIGVDPKGTITQWNREAEHTTHLSAEKVIGQPLDLVMPRLADEMANVRKAIQTRVEFVDPKRPREEKNKTYYEKITVYPLVANGVDGAVIRIDDITDSAMVEETLHQSQKLDAIGQLAGGVAHDFNNMLSGILGAAQLLKTPERNLDDTGKQYVDLILTSVARAADLTTKLLAFGRKGEILSTAMDVHNIIDDTLTIFNRTIDKIIKISIQKEAANHTVIGDRSAIQSALLNIGINASHAMPDGGELQIITKNITLDKIFCDASSFGIEPGEYIDIQIRDTGTGILQEHLQKIFDPFFTTKTQSKGTGLGLAAAYGTVQDHHGAIYVYTEVGTGTVFHIYLPCSEETVRIKQTDEKVVTGAGMVMLVDDEDIIRITGKLILESMGYDVLIAENGKEGLDLFRNRHNEIDLVIMDMIMPEMNGRDAFIQMKKIDENCKVIISSGFLKDESLDELLKLGLAGFIHKPFRDYELNRLLAEVLKDVQGAENQNSEQLVE